MKKYLRFTLTFLTIATTLFITDILVHGILLADQYLQTSYLWRSQEEMRQYFLLNILTYLAASFIAVIIFEQFALKLDKKDLLKNSFKISILISTLIAIILSRFYVYTPLTLTITFAWLLNALLHGIIAGLIFYLFYKNLS